MARKVVNRKQLRVEAEAAEALEKADGAPKKKKAPVKRKKKAAAEVRVKLFYGVFNQSLKRVALYEFNQKKQAEKKALELGKDGKTLVLRPGRDYEELAVNELERFSSTPLVHGDRVYVRTDATLYCIGKPSGD